MTAKSCYQFTAPKFAVGVLTVASVLAIAVTDATSRTQSNIITSTTEDIGQVKPSFGGAADCRRIVNVTSPVRAGQQAFEHWVDRCGKRAELETKPTQIGGTYWQGWSMQLPTTWVNSSDWYDIVAQWATYPTKRSFRSSCGAVGSYMVVDGDTLSLHLQHQGNAADIQCDKYPLGNINNMKGKWVDFVMHAKWTGNSDGFVQLWMKVGNGSYVQMVNYTGRTFWNDEDRGPYFKMGLYKGSVNWKGPGAPRYLYTDEYRLGNANSSFAEVSPGGVGYSRRTR